MYSTHVCSQELVRVCHSHFLEEETSLALRNKIESKARWYIRILGTSEPNSGLLACLGCSPYLADVDEGHPGE